MTLMEKTKAAHKAASLETPLVEEVDRYASLKAKLSKAEEVLTPMRHEVEKLEEQFLIAADQTVSKDEKVVFHGQEYDLSVSAHGRSVVDTDVVRLRELLGDDLLLEIAKFNVTDLKRYLSENQLAEVVTYDHVTKRRLKLDKREF